MTHIGDIYFNYFFLNMICKQNPNIHFYYYFINGDAFFENIKNISRIFPIESEYSCNLINGEPPENLVNNEILQLLIKNNMKKTIYKKIIVDNKKYLFVNLWCASDFLSHTDFDFMSAIPKYSNLIDKLNNDFLLDLNFKIIDKNQLIETEISENLKLDTLNLTEQILNESIIIFNFKPRSTSFNMDVLNKYIYNLSKDNKIILTSYDKMFDDNNNISFIDRDYKICKTPKCDNLLLIWDIAVKCKHIIILPTGSAFLFFHKLDKLNETPISMFNDVNYYNLLNKNTNYFTNKNIVNLILLNN
jgi:hypothetical protein